MDQPLRTILSHPKTYRILSKWFLLLNEFDIVYHPRSSQKVQVLTDFIVECIGFSKEPEQTIMKPRPGEEPWILHVDGASNFGGSGAGLILTNRDGVVTECALRFKFATTNNQAKYEALLVGLRVSHELGVQNLKVFTDSRLVAGQVSREYEARDP